MPLFHERLKHCGYENRCLDPLCPFTLPSLRGCPYVNDPILMTAKSTGKRKGKTDMAGMPCAYESITQDPHTLLLPESFQEKVY